MKPLVPLVTVVVIAASVVASEPDPSGPFAFFAPTVRISASDRNRLDKGEVLARVLPADDGHIAFFAATRLRARPEALIEWTRAIEELKRGRLVLGVGRFSDEVVESDLDGLVLDKSELDSLKDCRVGDCEVKLAASEITSIQNAVRVAGADWQDAARREFRRILVGRVRLHRERGLLALPSYAGNGGRMSVAEAFSALTARSPYLTRAYPDVINALVTPPRAPAGKHRDAFYYWSQERFGSGKTVVSVTYVQLLWSDGRVPQAATVSTHLYASHYIDSALGVTAVMCGNDGGPCYLTYLNRTRVDLLGGLFGGFKRAVIEDRIESAGPELMRGVVRRLESGAPAAGRNES